MNWTPYKTVILNKILRILARTCLIPEIFTPWKHGEQWIWLCDDAKSNTLECVYGEITSGFYKPMVELKPGDNVLDIGAHVGGWSIWLALKNPGVNFICYEPDPKNFRNLCKNIVRNAIQNIEAVNAGIWSHSVKMASRHYFFNTGGSSSLPTDGPDGIPGVPFELIQQRHNLDKIKVLKVDAEGAEFKAFQSIYDFLGVESCIMEIHGGSGNPEEMVAIVRSGVPHTRLQVLPDPEPYILENGVRVPNRNLDGKPITKKQRYHPDEILVE